MSDDFNVAQELKFIHDGLEGLDNKLDDTNSSISRLKEAIYNPDEGLYSRIRKNEDTTAHLAQLIEEHESRDEEKLNKLHESCHNLAKAIEPLKDDYKIRMHRKKFTDKIIIIVLGAIVAILVPTIWKVFVKQTNEQTTAQIENK